MTRHGNHIEKYIFTFFSILICLPILSQNSSVTPAANLSSTANKMTFPNAFWGNSSSSTAETFCIFRNYGFSVDGLGQLSLHHQSNRFRIDVENRGSSEWHSQLALCHYALNLSPNHRISLGLGGIRLAGSAVAQQSSIPDNAALVNVQYLFTDAKLGKIVASYRTCATSKTGFFNHWILGSPMESVFSMWQYDQALFQLIWLGHNKTTSHRAGAAKINHFAIPFAQLHYGAQRQFLEVGMAKPFGQHWQAFMAINTTNQPLRWGLIHSKKSWSGGLDVAWLRPLGLCLGWQVRYQWQ